MTDKEFKAKFDLLNPHPYTRGCLKYAKKQCMSGKGYALMTRDFGGKVIVYKNDRFLMVKYGQEIEI
jgi:hypothetical protein